MNEFSPTYGSPHSGFNTLTPDQTHTWLEKYRKRNRIMTWGFSILLFLVLSVIFIVFADDVGREMVFVYIVLTFVGLLASALYFTHLQQKKGWIGIIRNKHYSSKIVTRSDLDNNTGVAIREKVETFLIFVNVGSKVIKVVVSKDAYNYFREGDKVFKLSGFSSAELCNLRDGLRICIVCGKILHGNQLSKCSKCRAPIPDFLTLAQEAGFAPATNSTSPESIRNHSNCSCGAVLLKGNMFCETCGKRVDA